MQAAAAIAECFQRVAPPGSDLYYATLWCEPQTRAQIISVHALVDELIAIARTSNDSGVARIKLAWWNEELSRVLAGGGNHAISIALRETGALVVPLYQHLIAVADFCADGLSPQRFSAMPALHEAYRNIEGALWQHTAQLLGSFDTTTLDAATNAGMAIGLIYTLQHLREVTRLPTVRLPEDILSKHGLKIETLRDGASPTAVAGLAGDMAAHIRLLAEGARVVLRGKNAPQLLPLRIMLALKLKVLDEIQADGFALMQRRVVLTPLHRFLTAMLCRYGDRR